MNNDGGDPSKNWTDSVANTVNGKPLDAMSWATSVLTVAPGYHRLKNAFGLTAGLYLGRKIMNIAVGEKLNGDKIHKEDLPKPLRPLHGKLAYNKHSDEPRDRWMKVLDHTAPAILGAVGAVAGSYQFFGKRYEALSDPEFMDEYEEAMSLQESKPWSVLSGGTSLLGSASGASLGPGANYGAALGTRFTLAGGRKIGLPGVGKLITNSHSIYPYGPPQLIDRMIEYAAGNPDQDPKQLEAMAHGVLAPWFKDVKEEHVRGFVDVVKGVRDNFLQEGGIPEEAQSKVQDMLRGVLKKEGLEQTIRDVGLDPLDASLGDNGFATTVAKLMGKGKKLAGMSAEFAEKYKDRNPGLER